MSSHKPKIIKKQTAEKLEENLYRGQISVAIEIVRWLKLKQPEKAKELVRKMAAEVA